MTRKIICDICGKEIPILVDHPGIVKPEHYSGTFMYAAITIDESDDLCAKCGKLVRDYIRQLKAAKAEKK